MGRITHFVLVLAVSIACGTYAQQPDTDEQQRWNDIFERYEALGGFYEYPPNPFLSSVLDGRTPGTALDIAMGQGRNSLLMASRGWEVTGFDFSEVAVGQARAEASKRGLQLNALIANTDTFNYGNERFDLVAGIYVHELLIPRAPEIVWALKPGGILVVEGFHSSLVPFGYDSNELLDVFSGLTVLHYEETEGTPDEVWHSPGEVVRFVRFLGQKP